ncbi:MAG: radical SAM protein, partial [Firmicutes bacterium]|nr:radical SAM protein [Bacillota bacterium]
EDTLEYDIFSANEAVSLAPDIARLYPTVVIKDTALWDMMECGDYVPMSEDDSVMRTAVMYKILTDAGINVIRVGLKSSDIISDDNNTAGTFHPAFRQLVEGFLAKESLEKQVKILYPNIKDFVPGFDHPCPTVAFVANPKCYNNMFGHGGKNRKYFENEYMRLNIRYMKDKDAGVSLADNQYLVIDLK